jgi:hypothetical protein
MLSRFFAYGESPAMHKKKMMVILGIIHGQKGSAWDSRKLAGNQPTRFLY